MDDTRAVTLSALAAEYVGRYLVLDRVGLRGDDTAMAVQPAPCRIGPVCSAYCTVAKNKTTPAAKQATAWYPYRPGQHISRCIFEMIGLLAYDTQAEGQKNTGTRRSLLRPWLGRCVMSLCNHGTGSILHVVRPCICVCCISQKNESLPN